MHEAVTLLLETCASIVIFVVVVLLFQVYFFKTFEEVFLHDIFALQPYICMLQIAIFQLFGVKSISFRKLIIYCITQKKTDHSLSNFV